MPNGSYYPSAERTGQLQPRIEDRPFMSTINPMMRFVSFEPVNAKCEPTSCAGSRTWLIEGYGPSPADARLNLAKNISEFKYGAK